MNEYIFILKFQKTKFYINFVIFHTLFLTKFHILFDFALLLNKNQFDNFKETKTFHFKHF